MSIRQTWSALFTQSLEAFSHGDMQGGQRLCDRLVGWPGMPEEYQAANRRNMVHYAPLLSRDAPTYAELPIGFNLPAGWSITGVTLGADRDGIHAIAACASPSGAGSTLAVLRLDASGNSAAPPRPLRTQNADGSIASGAIDIDDLRGGALDGGMIATCRVGQRNAETGEVSSRMCLATLDPASGTARLNLIEGSATTPASDGAHLYLLAAFSPVTAFACDPDSGLLDALVSSPAPDIAAPWLPATNAIPDGDGWLCLTAETAAWEDGHLTWLHRVVRLGPDFEMLALSHPFRFQNVDTQRANGLARRDDRLMIAFMSGDDRPWIATINEDDLFGRLIPAREFAYPGMQPAPLPPVVSPADWGRVPPWLANENLAAPDPGWSEWAGGVWERSAAYMQAVRAATDFPASTARSTAFLLMTQRRAGIRGNMLEIGVDAGWYFVVLASALFPDERAVAVDLWDWQGQNVDRSGYGRRQQFEERVDAHAPGGNVLTLQANS
ncbi:MAG: hypothetical protein ACR2J8_15580, partial [Thermomicrobiales bacterium]